MRIRNEATFQGTDVLGLFSKYRGILISATVVSMLLALAVAGVLPKKYKARSVLTIEAKYFQSPLIREFVPELNERADVKAEASSLVRRAMTPDFLDKVGEEYGIYQAKRPSLLIPTPARFAMRMVKSFLQQRGVLTVSEPGAFDISAARADLRERIEILDLNDTTFQISFVYPDPQIAFAVSQEINRHLVQDLSDLRARDLQSIRDAIQRRLEFLAVNVNTSTAPTRTTQSDLAREELTSVREQIRTVSAQYTDEHPMLQELRSREQTLSRMVGAAHATRRSPRHQNPVIGGESQESVREMYNDLLRKMNYLNIALESGQGRNGHYVAVLENPLYPKEPIGPKKFLFALWGSAMGLFGSLFLVAIREYFDRSTIHADTLALQLRIPLLGHLPVVSLETPRTQHRQ